VRDCIECPPLVLVPPPHGSGRALAIARHELTWREYMPSVVEQSCPLPPVKAGRGAGYPKDLSQIADDFPFTGVPPTQIGCYLDWLKKKTGKTYRLPTAVEWTHAARAGTATTFPWGDEIGFDNAAISLRYSGKRHPSLYDPRPPLFIWRTVAVESFKPNAWGLYDVVGNVAEYIADSLPGEGTCLVRVNPVYCRRQEVRGGGTGIVSIMLGGGEVTQPDPIGIPSFRFAGAAQPVGYRLVRD